MSRLTTHEYWEERYQQDPEPFDWLQRYSTSREFREALKKQLRPADTTLVVGAGSSRLPEELFADGHTKLTAVDWSSTCVNQLKERYARSQNLKIETAVMDARSMDFNDGSFDACIDKALLDAVLCGGDDAAQESARKLLAEIARVCKASESTFLLVSIEPPDVRLPLLKRPEFNWKVTSHPIAKPTSSLTAVAIAPASEPAASSHFLYVCARGGRGG